MSMTDWAKKECELLRKEFENEDGDDDYGYGAACVDSALRAFESLMADGDSGSSIKNTQALLTRLIDGLPLTPIKDTPDVWGRCDFDEGREDYQCNRCTSLFKHVKGDIVKYSSVDNYICIDINTGFGYTGGGPSGIVDELYPITMPYWPSANKIKVYAEDFLVDPTFGDFDTRAYLYLIHPIDGRIELNRFEKETVDGWIKIDKCEYDMRKEWAQNRVKTEWEQPSLINSECEQMIPPVGIKEE